jgi:hypothetical protein
VSPRNGRRRPARPRIELAATTAPATQEEAAAIAAAIEGFLRDTAPAPQRPAPGISPWTRAARFEGVGRGAQDPSPWGDSEPWGRGAA